MLRLSKKKYRCIDKGYVDYEWFNSLTTKEIFFMTRLRGNAVYEVIESKVLSGRNVISDKVIQLNSAHALERGAPRLRRAESDQYYEFLTNNFRLSITTITAIYKDHWQVELFFRAIKQNLKIKTFVGTYRNPVLTQIWIAMIVYLLMSFARYAARSGWTIQRILKVIQLSLFDRKTLKEVLAPNLRRRKQDGPQMRLVI